LLFKAVIAKGGNQITITDDSDEYDNEVK